MFESLKHWLASLNEDSKLFNDIQDETLHSALAAVLYHVVAADGQVSKKEKNEFSEILRKEFSLNDTQIEHLYKQAKSSTSELRSDLETINTYLKAGAFLHLGFLKKLNHLINLDGVKEKELDIFYEAMREIFPSIQIILDDEED